MDKEGLAVGSSLARLQNGALVRVAGIVTHRQRPGTASGVVFATLEDEVRIITLIIWSRGLDEQREAVLGAQLMVVDGTLHSEQGGAACRDAAGP